MLGSTHARRRGRGYAHPYAKSEWPHAMAMRCRVFVCLLVTVYDEETGPYSLASSLPDNTYGSMSSGSIILGSMSSGSSAARYQWVCDVIYVPCTHAHPHARTHARVHNHTQACAYMRMVLTGSYILVLTAEPKRCDAEADWPGDAALYDSTALHPHA